jgi:hypothetical protein
LFFIPKQRAWYLFPSFPFYAMAIAVFTENKIDRIKPYALYKYISIVLLTASIIFITVLGGSKFKRDQDLYDDILVQKHLIPARSTIYVCPQELMTDWSIGAYLQRYLLASVTSRNDTNYDLILLDSKRPNNDCPAIKNKDIINTSYKRYKLYR